MVLRNRTVLTSEQQIRFSKKLFWQTNRKTILIIEAVLGIAGILIFAIYFENYWWIGAIALFLAALIPLVLKTLLDVGTRKAMQANQLQDMEVEQEYLFREGSMEVTIRVDGMAQSSFQAYDQFLEIVETKEDFVFMVEGSQAFYVSKAGFYEGTPQELSERLKELPSYRKY